jgi:hypothetical protein
VRKAGNPRTSGPVRNKSAETNDKIRTTLGVKKQDPRRTVRSRKKTDRHGVAGNTGNRNKDESEGHKTSLTRKAGTGGSIAASTIAITMPHEIHRAVESLVSFCNSQRRRRIYDLYEFEEFDREFSRHAEVLIRVGRLSERQSEQIYWSAFNKDLYEKMRDRIISSDENAYPDDEFSIHQAQDAARWVLDRRQRDRYRETDGYWSSDRRCDYFDYPGYPPRYPGEPRCQEDHYLPRRDRETYPQYQEQYTERRGRAYIDRDRDRRDQDEEYHRNWQRERYSDQRKGQEQDYDYFRYQGRYQEREDNHYRDREYSGERERDHPRYGAQHYREREDLPKRIYRHYGYNHFQDDPDDSDDDLRPQDQNSQEDSSKRDNLAEKPKSKEISIGVQEISCLSREDSPANKSLDEHIIKEPKRKETSGETEESSCPSRENSLASKMLNEYFVKETLNTYREQEDDETSDWETVPEEDWNPTPEDDMQEIPQAIPASDASSNKQAIQSEFNDKRDTAETEEEPEQSSEIHAHIQEGDRRELALIEARSVSPRVLEAIPPQLIVPATRDSGSESNKEIVLPVNSSISALGQAQMQRDENSHRRIARYGSVARKKVAPRYFQDKLEVYEIIRALRDVRIYIFGSENLVPQEDPQYLKKMLDNLTEIIRAAPGHWIADIQTFNYDLQHALADQREGPGGLSRRRISETGEIEGPGPPDKEIHKQLVVLTTHTIEGYRRLIEERSTVLRSKEKDAQDHNFEIIAKILRNIKIEAGISDTRVITLRTQGIHIAAIEGGLWRRSDKKQQSVLPANCQDSFLGQAQGRSGHRGFFGTEEPAFQPYSWPRLMMNARWDISMHQEYQILNAPTAHIPPVEPEPPPLFEQDIESRLCIPSHKDYEGKRTNYPAAKHLGSFDITGTSRGAAYMLAKLEITVSDLWKATKGTIPHFLRDSQILPSARTMLEERQRSVDRSNSPDGISGEAPKGNQLAKANITIYTQAIGMEPRRAL